MSQCSSLGDRLYCGIEFELNSDDPWAAGPPEEPIDIVAAVLARIELATFTIEPSPIHVQPAGGQVLVGMYTIFYTEPVVQRFSTRLLDRRVVLEVEPVQYVWDFGDDTAPVTATDPGQAYPQHTITHTYTSPATVTPELATRWVGRVWIEGIGGWFAVRGQGLTTGHGTPIETITKQNRLVAGE
ncbi:PKD domain-containing protein [Pseudactinotalea sp. HY160]|uniref:PKD domain-containing protein n=1 Tax=Pseudactinotalea sp. HY160 TaxID=2654490 RepID=UPI0018846E58|nr:PKD domain-containing protein [Pseudactinotalea sp. HY160]